MKKENQVLIPGILTITILCITLALFKADLNSIMYSNILDSKFLTTFSIIDSIFGLLVPIIILVFFTLTTSFMFTLLNISSPIKTFFSYLTIGFLPALASTLLAHITLTSISIETYQQLQHNEIDRSQVYGITNLSLTNIETISTIAYCYLYIHIFWVLYKILNINFIKSLAITTVPSILFFLTKYFI